MSKTDPVDDQPNKKNARVPVIENTIVSGEKLENIKAIIHAGREKSIKPDVSKDKLDEVLDDSKNIRP